MINIPENLPQEILDKYNPVSNSFVVKDTGDIHNKFETEIGDVLSDDFQPQVKIRRWDNECNFSVRLIDDEPTKPTIETEGNKIKFIKKDRECHFYDIEKGFEFEVILKKKPKTNLVQMSIETKGLKFYYQPSLKEEHKIGQDGAVEITDTDVKDKDGKSICHCPENVIGSYAVYHESKQGDYSKMGLKNYRAGKAFHIYRPKIIDSAGTEVWGKLNITDNLLTVEIPQEFLDNAVYPVRHAAGLTFGYETIGAYTTSIASNKYYGTYITSPSDIDTLTKLTVSCKGYGGAKNGKGLIAIGSSKNITINGVSDVVNFPNDLAWRDIVYSTAPTINPSTQYLFGIIAEDQIDIRVDLTGGDGYVEDAINNYTTPQDLGAVTTRSGRYISIYCTYTAGGAGPTGDFFQLF